MKNALLYENFVSAIKAKIPANAKLVNILMDLLYIEKEAVYRRLRREVPFTFSEIATISTALGISLDSIIGVSFDQMSPFRYKPLEFTCEDELDIAPMVNYSQILSTITKDDNSELADCVNVLPEMMFFYYEHLRKFYMFKSRYQYKGPHDIKKFGEITISEKLSNAYLECAEKTKEVTDTFYIWDHCVFKHIVNDLIYFAEIGLITNEEIINIKKDLLHFIDDLDKLAAKGKYESTGNRVLFYISNINFETGYAYLKTDKMNMSMVKAFALNSIVSSDEIVYQNMRRWIKTLKRLSTMISVSGERQRILFIKEQKEIINTL